MTIVFAVIGCIIYFCHSCSSHIESQAPKESPRSGTALSIILLGPMF